MKKIPAGYTLTVTTVLEVLESLDTNPINTQLVGLSETELNFFVELIAHYNDPTSNFFSNEINNARLFRTCAILVKYSELLPKESVWHPTYYTDSGPDGELYNNENLKDPIYLYLKEFFLQEPDKGQYQRDTLKISKVEFYPKEIILEDCIDLTADFVNFPD